MCIGVVHTNSWRVSQALVPVDSKDHGCLDDI